MQQVSFMNEENYQLLGLWLCPSPCNGGAGGAAKQLRENDGVNVLAKTYNTNLA